MSDNQTPRWVLRLDSFRRAAGNLQQAAETAKNRKLSDLEAHGLIKGFELAYELAWKVLKDYLEWDGRSEITGSRSAFRMAIQVGLLDRGELWMEMIESRNLTSHTYDPDLVEKLIVMNCPHPR